jgi:hypothetical protein
MNIQTVKTNLEQTIAGKEKMLKDMKFQRAFGDGSWQGDIAKQAAYFATQEFLEINIDELKRILKDVEACCEQANLDSWTRNPDRSGGQFTEEEMRSGSEWR